MEGHLQSTSGGTDGTDRTDGEVRRRDGHGWTARFSSAVRRFLQPARADEPASARGSLARPLARGITITVLAGYALVTLLNVGNSVDSPGPLAAGAAIVVSLYTLQLLLSSPQARKWPHRRQLLTLAAQAVLTFAPLCLWGSMWASMSGPFAGSVLLVLPARAAWPLYGLVQVVILLVASVEGLPHAEVGYFTVASMLTGLVVYGLTRLTDLVYEAHENRAVMARMAVTQERLRFARDLHDLLGYSLSAITLKSELVHRLIVENPERARTEISHVLSVARQALFDVRLVASGYRELSLRAEAESVVDVMSAAEVETEVDISCGRLHPVVETVLATALREGVTNILRHSKVQFCRIDSAVCGDKVRLSLVNDGVEAQESADVPKRDGSGLGNLQARLSAIGGRLTAEVMPGGRYRMEVVAPLKPPPREHRAM